MMTPQPYPMWIRIGDDTDPALVIGWRQDEHGDPQPVCLLRTTNGASDFAYNVDANEEWRVVIPERP